MTTNQDIITGTIRTAAPAAATALLAQLVIAVPAVGGSIAWLNEQIAAAGFAGVTIDWVIRGAAAGAAVGGYYWGARKIGARWPSVERWLLGSAKTPTYTGRD